MATMKEPKMRRLKVKDILLNNLVAQDRDRTLLKTSVAKHGILQNIGVRPHPKRRAKYELIFGLGRWKEAKAKGKQYIWAAVIPCSDKELVQFAGEENLARSSPSEVQQGELFLKLRELGSTTREIADEFGISTGQVVERIKLVEDLPDKAKRAINSGKVAASTLEFVRSSVRDPTTRTQVIATVVEKKLDLDSTVQLVRGVQPTSEIYARAAEAGEAEASTPKLSNASKPRTEDLTFVIELGQSQVIQGPDGSLLVKDRESHRDRNLPDELGRAWLKLRPGDFVEFSFRHTTNVHNVNNQVTAETT
jgi:ParB/RepB/Spo0J family partition protein